MKTIEYLKTTHRWAHDLLEMLMDDVEPEMLSWHPPGRANPLGATYAHAILAEDGVVQGVLQDRVPLFAGTWQGNTGVEDPQIQNEFQWARDLELDLETFQTYAKAVRETTVRYLDNLSEADLDEEKDLTEQNLGVRTVGWCLGTLIIAHLNNMAGEISTLKGIQGAQGYPF